MAPPSGSVRADGHDEKDFSRRIPGPVAEAARCAVATVLADGFILFTTQGSCIQCKSGRSFHAFRLRWGGIVRINDVLP